MEFINFDEIKDFERNVGLIFDEMKIKSGLVFCKTTGKLVGFTEMGPINDELESFSRLCEKEVDTESQSKNLRNEKKEKDLAKYVIVFMVRGLFIPHLQYAFGHFASEGFDSDQIFPCALEAIRILESIGLYTRFITADGASPNRKYFRLHALPDGINMKHDVIFWTWNLFATSRCIYFVCDVPHLIKTVRNNVENSHGNKKTRNFMVSITYIYVSFIHIHNDVSFLSLEYF